MHSFHKKLGFLCDNKYTILCGTRKWCSFKNYHCDNTLHTHDSGTSEKDIVMTGVLPSTNYSLLHADNGATSGETLVKGEDTRALGRSNGGIQLKRKVPEGYSKLRHKTTQLSST